MATSETRIRAARTKTGQITLAAGLSLLLILSLVPALLMLIVSVKDPLQYQADPVGLTFPFHLGNFAKAFAFMAPNFLWTALVVTLGIGLNLLTSSLAAYGFARHAFPGKSALFLFITGLMFVPSVLVIFPLYLWNVRLGLRDVTGLIVSYWVLGHCFSVFFLHNAFKSISEEYFEAARLDGAGHLYIWRRIVLPLARPMIVTLAIMMLIWIYTNDYVWQYVMAGSSSHKMILVVVRGLGQTGSGGTDLDHGLESAGYVVASAPMLIAFALASQAFVRGLSSGGTKG